MSVSSKLRGAIALYVALLAAVLAYHAWTVERAAERGRVLTGIASRLRVVSSVEPARLAELSATAEKYLVTGDADYLERFNTLARVHGDELRRLASEPMSDAERTSLTSLQRQWGAVEAGVVRELDEISAETRLLAGASQRAL